MKLPLLLGVLICSIFSFSPLYAVHSNLYQVLGMVRSEGTGVEGAIVEIMEVPLAKTMTDSAGRFNLEVSDKGGYILKVNFLGFKTIEQKIEIKGEGILDLGVINLVPDVTRIREMEVIGKTRQGSQNQAIALTKSSKQIVTVLSGEGIKKLPDRNAADALKRVAGIAVTNNKGEGGYVSLRGTPIDWTSTLVNGDRLPVADEENTSRSFEFEVLPSDLIDNIFVTRTSTPDLEGDNVGGSINFNLKAPPQEKILKISAGGGLNFLARKPIMSANVVFGNVSKNKKLSYILNATYLGRFYGTDAFKFIYGNNFNHAINRFELRDYSGLRNTFGFNGGIDYKVSDKVKLGSRFVLGYMRDDKWQNRLAFTYSSGDNSTIKPQFVHGILNRTLYGGEIHATISPNDRWVVFVKYASYYNRFHYGNFPYKNKDSRNGYMVAEFTAVQPIVYTDLQPILTDGSPYDPNVAPDPTNPYWGQVKLLDVDSKNGNGDSWKNVQPQISNPYTAQNLEFLRAFSETNNTWEWDPAVLQLDVSYAVRSNVILKFGVKNRYKIGERNLGYHEWRVDRRGGRDTQSYLLSDFQTKSNRYSDYMKQLGSPYQSITLPYLTRNQLSNLIQDIETRSKGPLQDFYMNELNPEYRFWVGSSYKYKELQNAAYAMVDLTFGKVNIVAGLRFEYTWMKQEAFDLGPQQYDSASFTYYFPKKQVSTSLHYPAVLPTINLNYSINNRMNLKAAVSRTYHRQNFQETKPGAALIKYTDFLYVLGNPSLKPAFSYNADLIYEYYWGNKGMFSIGVYGKYVVDHIFLTNSGGSDPRENFIVKSFANADNSWVAGVEVDIKKQFDFLPKFLSGFGVSANVTYSYSRMKVPGRPQKQAMAEQTPLLYNLSLFYEKYGVNARIALNYTGSFLTELNLVSLPNSNGKLLHPNSTFDVFQGEYYSLDAQISYEFKNHFSVFVEANNLLDWVYKEYRGDPRRPIRVEYYRPRGQIGFTYQL